MDEKGKEYFDDKKKALFLKHLNEKWKNKICECCGQTSWNVPEDLVMPMLFIGGGITIGGVQYPQGMAVCTNCGNTKYFNAIIAGIVPAEEKKDGGKDAQ